MPHRTAGAANRIGAGPFYRTQIDLPAQKTSIKWPACRTHFTGARAALFCVRINFFKFRVPPPDSAAAKVAGGVQVGGPSPPAEPSQAAPTVEACADHY